MYKLLQDINCPSGFVPEGTVGDTNGLTVVFNNQFVYTLDFVKNSPDWFDEVPKWTDEDILKFWEYVYTVVCGFKPHDIEAIVKKMFDDYLK
jgi:hypothetical protein